MFRIHGLAALCLFAFTAAAQTDCLLEAEIVLSTEMWGEEVSWNLYGDDGGLVASGANYDSYGDYVTTVCMEDSCYTLELIDSFGDGWNGATISVNFPDLGIMLGPLGMETGDYAAYAVGSGDACSGDPIGGGGGNGGGNTDVWGCMDPDALNYDANATVNCCCQYPVDCGDGNTLTIAQQAGGLDSLGWGFFAQFTVVGADGWPWYPEYSGIDDAGNWVIEGCLPDGCYNLTIHNNSPLGAASTFDILVNGAFQESITVPGDQFVYETGLGINDPDCVFSVYGCTDPEAPNYNPDATADDGSCLEPCNCPDVYEPVCGYEWFSGQTITFNNLCELECAGAYLQWEGDCSTPPVYGCMDPEALNYDPDATADSGWCVYTPECDGSSLVTLTSAASSLDSLTGNVIGLGLSGYFVGLNGFINDYTTYYDDAGNQVSFYCLEDGCYNFHVYNNGWTIGGAIEVTVDGGDPETFVLGADQFEAVFPFGINETDCEVYIPGCTDPEAMNYNPNATEDDGSCQYPFSCPDDFIVGQLYVCTFSQGSEVGLTIVDSQGEVLYSQDGYPDFTIDYIDVCLDPEECYTAIMTNNAGGTSWNGGYFWIQTWNGDWVNGALQGADSESIEFGMAEDCGDDISNGGYGCTDPAAINYDPFATWDDGSCQYDDIVDSLDCGGDNLVAGIFFPGDPFVSEVSWAIVDSLGNAVSTGSGSGGNAGTPGFFQDCLPDGCYTLELYDSFGDGWGGGLLIITVNDDLALTFSLEEGEFASYALELGDGCGGSPLTIWGCTDPGASNFNPDANADDGSCEFNACPLIEVTFVTYTFSNGDEVSWTVEGTEASSADSTWMGSGPMGDFNVHTHTACMAAGCYTMTLHDASGDGWDQGWVEIWTDGTLMASASYDVNGDNTMSMGLGVDCDGDGPGINGGSTNAGMSGWDDTVDFSVYPTPTGEIVNVLGEGFDNESPVVVRIKDMVGKLVAERQVIPAEGPAGWIFDVRDWPAGIYTAEGTQGSKVATGKIMVSH